MSSIGGSEEQRGKIITVDGKLNGRKVRILLDGGADGVFVSKELLPQNFPVMKEVKITPAVGPSVMGWKTTANLECEYYRGNCIVIAVKDPAYDVFLGNVSGTKPFPGTLNHHLMAESQKEALNDEDFTNVYPDRSLALDLPPITDTNSRDPVAFSIMTRAQSKLLEDQSYQPGIMPEDNEAFPEGTTVHDIVVDRVTFAKAQRDCLTLRSWFEAAEDESKTDSNGERKYVLKKGLLYRIRTVNQTPTYTLAVPKNHRAAVLYLAHHSPLAGHFAFNKTYRLITRLYAWPNLPEDVKKYCNSCKPCQLTALRRVPRVPLEPFKLNSHPFSHVCTDIVGPFDPPSKRGHRFILTIVDVATRYPMAVPLASITAEKVAEALFHEFCNVGIPVCITTDNGRNFTSEMFKTFTNLLEMRHITTSTYHAQSNGACERFNGTLKQCLKKMVIEEPTSWDKCLPALLFAYRDAPQASTGYSPFQLIYGHEVRGPLNILKECYEAEVVDHEDVELHDYVFTMRRRLKGTCKIAEEALSKVQDYNRTFANGTTKARSLNVGSKVLVLLPTSSKKILMKWKGPYVVVRKIDQNHYIVQVDDVERKLHINMLKKYLEDGDDHSIQAIEKVLEPKEPEEYQIHSAIAIEDSSMEQFATSTHFNDPYIPTGSQETFQDVDISTELKIKHQEELQKLCLDYRDILTDVPGRTSILQHKIELIHDKPLKHSYPLPFHLHQQLKSDLKSWLDLGVIEKSNSPYCSPLLAVRKKYGTHRFCLDCRQLFLPRT